MSVIEVQGLTKSFRTYKKNPGLSGAIKGLFHREYEMTLAVKDVSFSVEEGELVGFLGPNGAGKTTTLKMLSGLLYPTSGSAKVLGYVPWERKDGYRRQFALLLEPKVLFLDEPTIGLDVVSQKTVREFLRHHNAQRKTTILLTSHYMADIQELCQRVIIIDHGTIFFDGRLGEILDRFADSKLVTIQCEGAAPCSAEHLGKYGEIVEQTPGRIQLKVKRDRVIPVCKALLDELAVSDIDIQEVPIEEVIRRIFARDLAAQLTGQPA